MVTLLRHVESWDFTNSSHRTWKHHGYFSFLHEISNSFKEYDNLLGFIQLMVCIINTHSVSLKKESNCKHDQIWIITGLNIFLNQVSTISDDGSSGAAGEPASLQEVIPSSSHRGNGRDATEEEEQSDEEETNGLNKVVLWHKTCVAFRRFFRRTFNTGSRHKTRPLRMNPGDCIDLVLLARYAAVVTVTVYV